MRAKELTQKFLKVEPKKIGIYGIYNISSEKIYIGQSRNIYKRINSHKSDLTRNKHINKHLQAAWNLYGELNFISGIIELCDISLLAEREKYWIDSIEKNDKYNMQEKVFTFSDEQIKNIKEKSKNKIGHKMSELGKIKWIEKNKGRKRTEEQIKNIILGRLKKGEFFSKESREKISLANKGKPKKPEAIEKMRLKKIGRRDTEETKRKKSESFKNSQLKKDLIKVEKICQFIWWILCLVTNMEFKVFIERDRKISHREVYKQNKLVLKQYVSNNSYN